MTKKTTTFFFALSFFLVHPWLLAKGDIAKGQTKAATCMACHGPQGISNNPLWPNLAGQQKDYLIKQIKAFKSGIRKDPSMAPMVAPLTEEDIKNLAAYYSSLKCSP